jgi:hypothetical protein
VYSVHLDCLRSGVDGLAFDPLAASWGLTPAAYEACARLAASWGRPLLLLGGGGYHSPSAAVTWAKVLAALMGRQLPEDVPEHEHFPQYGPAFTLASGAAHSGNITLPHSPPSLRWLAAQPACLPAWLPHSLILQCAGGASCFKPAEGFTAEAAMVPPGLPAPAIRLAVSPCSLSSLLLPLVVLPPPPGISAVTKRLLPRDSSRVPEVMAACRHLLGELREAVARTLGGQTASPVLPTAHGAAAAKRAKTAERG